MHMGMTDNEIIKALDCCAHNTLCDGCPYDHSRDGLCSRLDADALDLINRLKAELLQYAKDQHDLMIEKDELFDIAEKQKAEIEFLIRMKASDFETSYTAVKARLADEMNRAEMDRRKDTEIRQLRIKLDDCERDIIPKLKYSLERANKYGLETEAENIRLLKENEDLKEIIFTDRAEAIKDFAERLKERTISYVGVVEQQEVIDNLVKKMIGEQ